MFSFARKNIGERDEPLIIEKLVALRGKRAVSLGTINSVANYLGSEYPDGIKSTQIMKAPAGAKRDVVINRKGYSLKSTRAAPPAIVNHTTREKWTRVCGRVGVQIDMLDEMVSKYWELRTKGKIAEDVPVSNPRCPFGNTRKRLQYLKALTNYFLFDGTGSEDARYPADCILEFTDPSDETTWRVWNRKTAFAHMWPKMVFSIRAKKGMPSNYRIMRDVKKKAQIAPWVRYIDGDYRGALHVRTRR